MVLIAPCVPKISYSVHERKKLRENITTDSLKFVLMTYDIACILSSHLKVQFSPMQTPNIGLTDGEGVERFWSYLHQFSTITKEMSVDKRVDVLTDASLHYGEHLFYRFDGCDLDTVRQWMDNEMAEIVPREKDLSLQWDATYVELLVTASKLKSQIAYAIKEQEPSQVDMQRKMSRNENTLLGLEIKHGIRLRWQENDATFRTTQQRLSKKKRTLK